MQQVTDKKRKNKIVKNEERERDNRTETLSTDVQPLLEGGQMNFWIKFL